MSNNTTRKPRAGDLSTNPALWEALRHGEMLTEVLDDFYRRVYDDPRLAPFFEGVTKEWVAQKQYSFLRSKITGESTYFGERPRNAHHWMVISHELFDHREALLEGCFRRAGLADEHVRWLRNLDEAFRKQIVKSEPVPRKMRGVALPLDGYDSIEIGVGCACDGCMESMEAGQSVRYHQRTGKAYCERCIPPPRSSQS